MTCDQLRVEDTDGAANGQYMESNVPYCSTCGDPVIDMTLDE